jgi:hypothetical protein
MERVLYWMDELAPNVIAIYEPRPGRQAPPTSKQDFFDRLAAWAKRCAPCPVAVGSD